MSAPTNKRSLFGRALDALPAIPLLAGVLLGFLGCCIAGRIVSREKLFVDFHRIYHAIEPQTQFYVTTNELLSYVRHEVPKDKTLVLIGGASYFRGMGQDKNELWSKELQKKLGPDYAVVNYGADLAGATAFAGVAFQILAQEYPKILYIANIGPVEHHDIDGGELYRFIFWDAYYKGLLPSGAGAWAEDLQKILAQQRRDSATKEMHLGKWLDSYTYSCDLWNFVGYRHFFTVWTLFYAFDPFRARSRVQDLDDPDIRKHQLETRQNAEYARISEERGRAYTKSGLYKDENGVWHPYQAGWDALAKRTRAMFPDGLREKCILVLIRGNPYFMKTFTQEDIDNMETLYRLGEENLKRQGYQVVQMTKTIYDPDDFTDAGHFTASGGRKLAQEVADHILNQAKKR